MGLKVIITGVTGMVGEGVLIESLQNDAVESILVVARKPLEVKHSKLKSLIVSDFFQLNEGSADLKGYDACFYCAGISSNGLTEEVYTKITYDTTIHFAKVVAHFNPDLVFNFVSGSHTDSTEKGKVMWARVKGKTENALQKMFQGREYNFRPALMKPFPGQKQLHGYNKWVVRLFPLLNLFFPSCTLQELARAMIHTSVRGYSKPVLEVSDIKSIG